MRHIFNKLDTTPHPSCTAKLEAKAQLCSELAVIQGKTADREAAVETAMANFDEAVDQRDKTKAENITAKDDAFQLNTSISPVKKTANRLEVILNKVRGRKRALAAFKESFIPILTDEVIDALKVVVAKMNELVEKEKAVTDKQTILKNKQDLLAQNTKNIESKTAEIAAADAGMTGLNCDNTDGCNVPPPS
jgi:hypothetical protein